MSVYSKLGITGVYYGNKFGYKTKWITSFPYNILSNPQYVGCILTFLGLYGLIDTHYIIYSIILYLITMYFESLPSIKPLVKKNIRYK
jgi:methylene-fatty-acyl-phospholipid synthase